MSKEMYTVYSQRLAGLLMTKGFVLCGMDKSKTQDKHKNVFFFNKSNGLLDVVEEYKKKLNK